MSLLNHTQNGLFDIAYPLYEALRLGKNHENL